MNKELLQVVEDAVRDVCDVTLTPVLTRPDPQFGDFATNVAMQLAGRTKKNPRDIAEKLAVVIRESDLVMSAEIAGPGFLNIRLQDRELLRELEQPLGVHTNNGQIIVIETNNPNPFKDLHIGHAYNCIVADTLANLLEASGAEVHRVSYHGDVGLHVGKSMWAILRWINGDISKLDAIAENERPAFMSQRYIEGANSYNDDPAVREEIESLARESFAPTDELYKKVYETCKEWSFSYITKTVAKLGSKPVERRYLESEADSLGVATVRANVGEVFTESDGAIVFGGEAFGLHTRVFIASRGTGVYEARDLGLMQLKQQEFHPAKSYIVTAVEQREYFKVVIKAAEMVLPELNNVTKNISTGTVKLSTGKMKSRTGEVLNIEWLFDQLKAALAKHETKADENDTLIGALRYSLLRPRIGGDVVFDVDTSLSLEGNSGPYLQYAHARAQSILRKSEKSAAISEDVVLDKSERELVLKISEYDEVVAASIAELLPHLICTYLYELSQTFNRFYEHSRIIGDEREELRLWLVSVYAKRLRDGLGLLGIPAPDSL